LTTIKQYSIFLNRYFGYQLNDYALEINYQWAGLMRPQ